MQPTNQARVGVEGRRPGHGVCTVLIIRQGGVLRLHPHGTEELVVELDETAAVALADGIYELIGAEQ